MFNAARGEDSRLITILLIVCAVLPATWIIEGLLNHERVFTDFFGLWSSGRYVLEHPPASLYDPAKLEAFQRSFGMPTIQAYPFSYPPWFLLPLVALAALPWPAAHAVWALLTLAAYIVALEAWRWPRKVGALLLLAPTSTICCLVGQNGLLTAALILGGLKLLQGRPLLAGALLACAGYKPQFAIVLPFVLLFGGHWRAMIGGALAAAALTIASALAFGPDVWVAWFDSLHHSADALTGGRPALFDLMPTVTAAVRLLGGGPGLARFMQAAAIASALVVIWRLRRRSDPEAHAAVVLAILLAAPYAFHYDLPVVTGALLAVIAARTAPGAPPQRSTLAMFLPCILAPVVMVARPGVLSALVPAIFVLTLWALIRTPAPAHPAKARLLVEKSYA